MGNTQLNPEWLGANVVVTGCNDFLFIPTSSWLQADNGATLIVDIQNYPRH